MKLSKTLTLTVALLLVASFAAFAGEETLDAKKATTTEAKTEAPIELKNQTHCPVMGGKIDSSAYTDIQGQRIYHCCSGCTGALKEDPDKFFKKAATDGILFENIQTTCPLCDMELKDKSVHTDFEGRRLAFCSTNCLEAFNEDPKTILAKLDAPADEEKKADMKGHEGHGH